MEEGKGNSYIIVHAFDVGPDGKLNRLKLTEYEIDDSLIGLLKMPRRKDLTPVSLLSKQVT